MEESCLRWRGAVSGGEERSQVEWSGLRWRGAVLDGGKLSQVERVQHHILKKHTHF